MNSVERWQYQQKTQPILPLPFVPSFGWFQQPPDPVRPKPQVQEGLAAQPELPQPAVAVPDFGWFGQPPPPVRPVVSAQEGLLTIPLLPIPAVAAPPFGWFVQPVAYAVRRVFQVAHLISGVSTQPLLPVVAVVVFQDVNWPFLGLFNPDDYSAGTVFFFEAVIDTDNASIPAHAQLFDITGGAAVPGTNVTTTSLHLAAGTRVRSGPVTLPSGDREYRARRGAVAGSGATVHIHVAKIIVDIP